MKTWKCAVCGDYNQQHSDVLWPDLIREWSLSQEEAAYVNRQQGSYCMGCRCNLRSIALADVIRRFVSPKSTKTFESVTRGFRYRVMRVLEINEAGHLSRYLQRSWNHILGSYPKVDMQQMPFQDNSFDLVVHSDTLEHVPDPVKALRECRRVLRVNGLCAFTIPTIVGRLSRSRLGMPDSFHGDSGTTDQGYLVRTEFGADMWSYCLEAGFRSVEISTIDYPAAQALGCRL